MKTLRWLHLSDLHIGMKGMEGHWPAAEAEFHRDLERIHAHAGPFDLVLFTGDLVQRGTSDEFQRLNEVLERLWDHLKTLGSEPVLLAVPGNHDLQRPKTNDPRARALLGWGHDPKIADFFWDEKEGASYHQLMQEMFGEYTQWLQDWYKRRPLPDWISMSSKGWLPGDFAASVRRGDFWVGFAGLNSAFLQLSGEVRRGGICIDPKQLMAVCGDPNLWAKDHHAGFLMTHHPPSWLSAQALASYNTSILEPSWFSMHIFGHMHEPYEDERSTGGAETRRTVQAASLFGLEEWTGRKSRKAPKRLFGYGAHRLDGESEQITLRSWPRLASKNANGRYELKPNFDHFKLDENRHNSFERVLAARRLPSQQPKPSLTIQSLQPLGAGYDPKWYVPNPHKERLALTVLREPGTPVVLTAPPQAGKTTMLYRLLDQMRQEDEQKGTPGLWLVLDAGKLSDSALDDPAQCIREVGEIFIQGYSTTLGEPERAALERAAWVDQAFENTRKTTPERKLGALMQERLLSLPFSRMVLAFDRFECLVGKRAIHPVARMLRQWIEQSRESGPWTKLRVIIAATGSSLLFSELDEVSELFNTVIKVRLEGFNVQHIRELAQLYKIGWPEEDIQRLHALVGGQPYLSRLIVYLAALGIPKSELLDSERLQLTHCAHQLNRLWLNIQSQERLLRPLCALIEDPTAMIKPDEKHALHEEGLIRHNEEGTGFLIPNRLLVDYIRGRCGMDTAPRDGQ